MFRGYFSPDV
jgi:hypothetical protein